MIDKIPEAVGVQYRRTCAVLCTVYDDNGVSLPGAIITAQLSYFDVDNGYITPVLTQVTTDENGEATLILWPNQLGATSSFYKVKIIAPNGKTLNLDVTVPDTNAERLEHIALLPPYPGKPDGFLIVEEAEAAARRAELAADQAAASAQQAGLYAHDSGVSADESAASAAAAKKYAEAGRAMATLWAFGAVLKPEDLPRDGLLKAASDGPDNPPVDIQFVKGQGMVYSLSPTSDTKHNHLYSYVGLDIDPSGWVDLGNYTGPKGDKGDRGDDGADGRSVDLIGAFGALMRPGNLPVDGLIPADFDGKGYPAKAIQAKIGEGLIYNRCPPTYAGYQDVWGYVGLDNSPTGWINLGTVAINKKLIIEKLGYTPADEVDLNKLTDTVTKNREDFDALVERVGQIQTSLQQLNVTVNQLINGTKPFDKLVVSGDVDVLGKVSAFGDVLTKGDVKAFTG
jgi:hypothetical protein